MAMSYEVEWHFIATSRGKSACDSFKRDAARASLQKPGKVFITKAKQLFEWTQKKTNSMTSFIFCSDIEHKEEIQRSHNRYNDNSRPVNAIEIETQRIFYEIHKQIFSLK